MLRRSPSVALGRRKPSGFTLIELMVVVVTAAILLAIAVPAMQTMVASNQLSAVTDSFASALNEARSEAGKYGVPVALITAGATHWGSGWTMFVDTNGNGAPDAGQTPPEITLRTGQPLSGTYSMTSNNAFAGLISFDNTGRLLVAPGTPTAEFVICQNNGPANGGAARMITVSASGRVRIAQNDANGNPLDDKGVAVTTCSP